jgi:hypothetical protein
MAALFPRKFQNRRVGGPLGRAGGFGEKKNPLTEPEIETLRVFLGIPLRIKTELYQLSNTAAE